MSKTAFLTLCTVLFTHGFATHPGSVISSFEAKVEMGGWVLYPRGITYGGGHLWLTYVNELITKRRPGDGSIVGSFYAPGSSGVSLGWDESRKYLYGAGWGAPVRWWNSKTGSLLGSFPLPAHAVQIYGIDYFDGAPSRPIWLCQWAYSSEIKRMIWNLTKNGSVVKSFDVGLWLAGPKALTCDGDTPGGPYLFVATHSAPNLINVVNPVTASVISSFKAPTGDYAVADLAWDGRYVWAVDNWFGSRTTGWVFRFVGHGFPVILPSSVGRIKALFR